jgi:hypothetical protein
MFWLAASLPPLSPAVPGGESREREALSQRRCVLPITTLVDKVGKWG